MRFQGYQARLATITVRGSRTPTFLVEVGDLLILLLLLDNTFTFLSTYRTVCRFCARCCITPILWTVQGLTVFFYRATFSAVLHTQQDLQRRTVMTRVRSPAYPAHNLIEAIEYIRKIHSEDRQHPVPRDVAARHMGFSGVTGTSDRALSSLLHYGLAEKAAKGEIRVTDLALRIMHPDDETEYRGAISEAAFSPQLFQELKRRYPGRPPAAATLESYLTREGFAGAAIGPASKAFLETCRFLQQENAYESDGDGNRSVPEEVQEIASKEAKHMHHQPITQTPSSPVMPGLRSDVFTLQGGGEIIANLPEAMSQRDYDDLKDWLELMQRKAERKVVKASAPNVPESAPPSEVD